MNDKSNKASSLGNDLPYSCSSILDLILPSKEVAIKNQINISDDLPKSSLPNDIKFPSQSVHSVHGILSQPQENQLKFDDFKSKQSNEKEKLQRKYSPKRGKLAKECEKLNKSKTDTSKVTYSNENKLVEPKTYFRIPKLPRTWDLEAKRKIDEENIKFPYNKLTDKNLLAFEDNPFCPKVKQLSNETNQVDSNVAFGWEFNHAPKQEARKVKILDECSMSSKLFIEIPGLCKKSENKMDSKISERNKNDLPFKTELDNATVRENKVPEPCKIYQASENIEQHQGSKMSESKAFPVKVRLSKDWEMQNKLSTCESDVKVSSDEVGTCSNKPESGILSKQWGELTSDKINKPVDDIKVMHGSDYFPLKKSVITQSWEIEENLKIGEKKATVESKQKLPPRKTSGRKPRLPKNWKHETEVKEEIAVTKDSSSETQSYPDILPMKRATNKATKKDFKITLPKTEIKSSEENVLSKLKSPLVLQESIPDTSDESKIQNANKGKLPSSKPLNKKSKLFKEQEVEKVNLPITKPNVQENRSFSLKKDKFYKDWQLENEMKINEEKPETTLDSAKNLELVLPNSLKFSECNLPFIALPQSGELTPDIKIGRQMTTGNTSFSDNIQQLDLSKVSKNIKSNEKVKPIESQSDGVKLCESKPSIKKARLYKNWEIENESKVAESKLKISDENKEAKGEILPSKKDKKTGDQKIKGELKQSEKITEAKSSSVKDKYKDWMLSTNLKLEEVKIDKSKPFFSMVLPEKTETKLKIEELESKSKDKKGGNNLKINETSMNTTVEKRESETKSPIKKTKFFRTWEKETNSCFTETKPNVSSESSILDSSSFIDNHRNYSLNWGIENGIAKSQNKIPVENINCEYLAHPEDWKMKEFKLDEMKPNISDAKQVEPNPAAVKVMLSKEWESEKDLKQEETPVETLAKEKQFDSKASVKKTKYLKNWAIENEENNSKIKKSVTPVNKVLESDSLSLKQDKLSQEIVPKKELDIEAKKTESTSIDVKLIDSKVPIRVSKEWELETDQKLGEIKTKPTNESKPKSSLGKKAKLLKEWEIENATKLEEIKDKGEVKENKILDDKPQCTNICALKDLKIENKHQICEKNIKTQSNDLKPFQEKPVRKSKLLRNWEIENDSKSEEMKIKMAPPIEICENKSTILMKTSDLGKETELKNVEVKSAITPIEIKSSESKSSPRQKKSRLKSPPLDISFFEKEKTIDMPLQTTSLTTSLITDATQSTVGNKRRKTNANKNLLPSKNSQKQEDKNIQPPCSFSSLKMKDFSKSFADMKDILTRFEVNPIKTKIKLTPNQKSGLSPSLTAASILKPVKHAEIKLTPKKKACDSAKLLSDSHKSHKIKDCHKSTSFTDLSKLDNKPTKVKHSREHTTPTKIFEENKKPSTESSTMKSFPAGGLTLIIKKDGKSMKVFSKSQSSENEFSERISKKEEPVKHSLNEKHSLCKESENAKIKKSSTPSKNKEHSNSDVSDKDSSHKNKKAAKKSERKQSSPKVEFLPTDSTEETLSSSSCKKKPSKDGSMPCVLNKELSVRVELSKMNLDELQKYPVKEETYKKSKKGSPRSFSDNETMKERSSDDFKTKMSEKDKSKHDLSGSRRRSHDFIDYSKEDLINGPIKKKMKKTVMSEIKS